MKPNLSSVINGSLSPLGVELRRRGTESPLVSQLRKKLQVAIEEMEKLARATGFPDLPEKSGRNELMMQLQGTQPSEALHLVWHLNRVLHLEGEVCEFGVAQGSTSALIANEIRETDKDLWLFDSFEGLPKPSDRDILIDDIFNLGSIERYQGTMACGQEQVIDRLKSITFPLERVKVVPGFIEQTAKFADLPKQVCFAYVDFDFYEPIKIALELLDSRLPVGGIVIVDDYGFFSEGAQSAVDEFVGAREPRYTKEPSPKWASKFCVLRKLS
jgi:hypothetical protein